jgi:hypothetical protein
VSTQTGPFYGEPNDDVELEGDELTQIKLDVLQYLTAQQYDAFHWYLREYNYRRGQAFFTALNPRQQSLLTGTMYDPFYKNSWASIRTALDHLLEVE